ncbi:MAG: hypothetical protein ACLRWH_11405 [Emergencia sp.]
MRKRSDAAEEAPEGTGVIAGGPTRAVIELAESEHPYKCMGSEISKMSCLQPSKV